MSRMKLVLVSCMALCAMLAVVGTSGASAVEYLLASGGFPQNFKPALIQLSDASLLKGELLFVKTEIECKHVELVGGELASATESKAHIDYLECSVLKPSGCGVKEPIEVHLAGEPTGTAGTKFKPESGTAFVEIELTGCAVKGKYEVTGSQVCETENGSEQTLHEMACNESGNELKFGGTAAHYTSQALPLELESGVAFGQG